MNTQELFNYMSNEHGLILLESDMFEIIGIVERIQLEEKKQQQDYIVNIIYDAVSSYFKYTIEDIKSNTSKHEVCLCRQIIAYFLKKFTKLSLDAIGNKMSDEPKHHATVLHSIKTINNYIDTDKYFAEDVKKISDIIEKHIDS